MIGRGEVVNDIASNGEADLMRRACAAFARRGVTGTFRAFDVGANMGKWTEYMLAAARDAGVPARVDAFEPIDATHAALAAKFAEDAGVVLHKIAVSDHVGEAEMFLVGETAGTNSLLPVAPDPVGRQVVSLTDIPTVMDELAVPTINLLKIDAEGHDFTILRGMLPKLRAGSIEVVQFEYNWRWLVNGASLRSVFDLIDSLDYEVGLMERGEVQLFDWSFEIDRFFERNYVIVRSDMVAALRARRLRWDDSNLLVVA
jgi:FkbM family methyltransferase